MKKIYFSGNYREYLKNPYIYGCMFNDCAGYKGNIEILESGCRFMVDNGVFSDKWEESKWKESLLKYLPYKHNCYGVVIPDFLYYLPNKKVIGDWQKTLERFELYYPYVKELGFKIAFVTQDGMPVNKVPWNKIDVLFIGGSDNHKRGIEAQELAFEAIKRDKHVHIGRVSSVSVMKQLWSWANSYDGTTFNFEPDRRYEKYTPEIESFFSANPMSYKERLF